MKDVIIVDYDGTLSDGRHRLHLLPKAEDAHQTYAWDKFNLAAGEDTPFLDTIELVRTLYAAGKTIIILTGRCDIAKELSEKWLWEHGVPYHQLIMRPAECHDKDTVFKERELRAIGLDRIQLALDDLEHICKFMRGLGITCYQVTHYDEKRVDNVHRVHYPERKGYGVNAFEDDTYVSAYNEALQDVRNLN